MSELIVINNTHWRTINLCVSKFKVVGLGWVGLGSSLQRNLPRVAGMWKPRALSGALALLLLHSLLLALVSAQRSEWNTLSGMCCVVLCVTHCFTWIFGSVFFFTLFSSLASHSRSRSQSSLSSGGGSVLIKLRLVNLSSVVGILIPH